MVTKELLDYIIYQLEQKEPWDKIRGDLVGNGWAAEVLEEAYNKISIIRPDFKLEKKTVKNNLAADLGNAVISGVNPNDSVKVKDISVDDIVFKDETNKAPGIEDEGIKAKPMEQIPPQMLNISQSFDPTKNIEQKDGKTIFQPNLDVKKDSSKIAVPITTIEVPKKSIFNNPKPNPIEEKKEPLGNIGNKPISDLPKTNPIMNNKPKKRFPILPLICLIIAGLIIGAGIFAYYNYIARENIAAKLLTNAKTIKSGDFIADISFNYELSDKLKNQLAEENGVDPESIKSQNIQALLTGKFNYKDSENAKLETSINLNSKSGNDEDYALNFEYKITDNVFYGRLNSLKIPDPYQGYLDSSDLKNYFIKWIKYDLPGQNNESFSKVFLTEMEKSNENLLNDVANASQVFDYSIAGLENINGKYCLKYKLTLNKEKLKEVLLSSANNTVNDIFDPDSKKKFEEDLKSFNENYDSFYNSYLNNLDLYIWTGILDFNVYKTDISMSGNVDGSKFSLTGNCIFNNLNSDLQVAAPEYSSDWQEIMPKIMETFISPNLTANDDEIKSAMAQAKLIAGNYKQEKSNYSGLELSVEMRRVIQDDINKWGGDPAVIFASTAKYCLSKQLPDTSSNWCTDSSDFANNGQCDEKSFACIPSETSAVINPINTADDNSDIKESINLLKSLLDAQKTNKGTYLGVVSSKDGIALVKEINTEGEAIVIATSKEKYCTMKKFADGTYYCTDSTGFTGSGSGCSNKTFVCNTGTTN